VLEDEEGVTSSATSVSHSQSSSSSSEEEEGEEVEEGPGVVKEGVAVLTAFNLTCTAASVAAASTTAIEEETA